MSPQPINQKDTDAMAKTMKFFARMLTVFLARHKPDSTMANPRFMKNTRNAVNSTQTVSTPTCRELFRSSSAFCVTGAAGAGAAVAGRRLPGQPADSLRAAPAPAPHRPEQEPPPHRTDRVS